MIYKVQTETFYNTCLTRIMNLILVEQGDKKAIAKSILDGYVKRTLMHINLVMESAKIVADAVYGLGKGFNKETFFKIVQNHDRDKLDDEDMVVYYSIACDKLYNTPTNEYDVNNDVLDRFELVEWPKHYKINPHHVDRYYGKKVDGIWVVEEPTNVYALSEMISDWTAMWLEKGDKGPVDWFWSNQDKKFRFNPTDREFIDKICRFVEDANNVLASIRVNYNLPAPKKTNSNENLNKSTITVKSADFSNKNDQEILKEVDKLATEASHDTVPADYDLFDHLKKTHSSALIGYLGNDMIGACTYTSFDQTKDEKPFFSKEWQKGLSLNTFAVLSKYQGKGYGYQFLVVVLKHMFGSSDRIVIGVEGTNSKAISLYKKVGCSEIKRGTESNGHPFVCFGISKDMFESNQAKESPDKKNSTESFSFESLNSSIYYRVTYEGSGIYDVLKRSMSEEEWKNFKQSDAATWLPVPTVQYKDEYRSYFTELGLDMFMKKTRPYIDKHLDENYLSIEKYRKVNWRVVYSDKYQIVTDGKEAVDRRYLIYGAILGCLGAHGKDVDYTVTEDLPGDPWIAIIKSSGLLTKQEIENWHKWHVVDVDKKGVPYYFIVKDVIEKKEYVWYTDDRDMMPINTKQEIEKAKEAGRKKHLVEEQLDFDAPSNESISVESFLSFPSSGIYAQISRRAKTHYKPVGQNSWMHIRQVFSQATRACRFVEHRDLNPKEFAAILYHDSSVLTDVNKDGHNIRGAEIARKELSDLFNAEDLEEVAVAIQEHDGYDKWSSITSDLLATGDANPPDPVWVINKSYAWGIKKGLNHEERIKNVITNTPAKYGSKGTMVYPSHYKQYFATKIKDLQRYLDNITYEIAERDIMAYRKKHHLGPDDLRLPEPSVEVISVESIHNNVAQHIRDNTVYHGAPNKYDELKTSFMGKWYKDKKGIFVTPFRSIAACFIISKTDIFDQIEKQGVSTKGSCNFKYDVWDKEVEDLVEMPKHITITIEGITGFKTFSSKATGYLYSIDYSKYKDDTSMFEKNAESDVEFIINSDIKPEKVEKITIEYTVKPGSKQESTEDLATSEMKPLEINPEHKEDRFKDDKLAIDEIDEKTLNMDLVHEIEKQAEHLEVLKHWITTPDYTLVDKLAEFGSYIDKLYKFEKPLVSYRGMRVGHTDKPMQNTMGIIDLKEDEELVPKPGVVAGYKFTYTTTGPMSVSRSVWLSKIYGDCIVKTTVPPECKKLVITNELAYILQKLDEKYPDYRPINLSARLEVIILPNQTLNYEVVTTNGDITSEMPEFKDLDYSNKKIELDPTYHIGVEQLSELLLEKRKIRPSQESIVIPSEEMLEVKHEYILKKLAEGKRCTIAELKDIVRPGDILIPYPRDSKQNDFMKIFHAVERTVYGMSFTSCKLMYDHETIIGYGVKNKIERGKSAFDKTTISKFLEYCGGLMVLRLKKDPPPSKMAKLKDFMDRYYRDAQKHDFNFFDAAMGTLAYMFNVAQGELDPKKMSPEDYNKLVCSSVVAAAFYWAGIDLGLPKIKINRIMPIHMCLSEKLTCVASWFARGEWNPEIEKQLDKLDTQTSSTEALSDAAINAKKKLIIDKICKICDIMDPSHLNSNRYHKILDHMTPKEFNEWMTYVKEGKWLLHIVAPNMVISLKNENLLKAADALGLDLFHRIWMVDYSTGRKFLTDNEYLVLPEPIRRQQQFLKEKASNPEDDKHIDGMTGQVTGASKATQITNPEINILAFRGLDHTLEEMVHVRGGNMVAYGEFKKQAEETGVVHMSELDPNTRSRTAVIAGVLLNAMHIENNI